MTVRRKQLALLLAIVPLTAACGSAGVRDLLSIDSVASAATRTESADSMRLAFSGSITGPWAGQRFGFSGSGVAAAAARSGRMHFRFDFPPAVRAQLRASPTMDMIFESKDGFVMYMRSPLLARIAPGRNRG